MVWSIFDNAKNNKKKSLLSGKISRLVGWRQGRQPTNLKNLNY